MEYNGAAIIGMTGDGCVGIAADSRYGIQQMTVGTNMKKIFKVDIEAHTLNRTSTHTSLNR